MFGVNLTIKGLILMLILLFSSVQAEEGEKKWPEKSCKDLYNAIGLFTLLADKEWKKKQEEKGAFYTSVASDYAKIYQTVCEKNR